MTRGTQTCCECLVVDAEVVVTGQARLKRATA